MKYRYHMLAVLIVALCMFGGAGVQADELHATIDKAVAETGETFMIHVEVSEGYDLVSIPVMGPENRYLIGLPEHVEQNGKAHSEKALWYPGIYTYELLAYNYYDDEFWGYGTVKVEVIAPKGKLPVATVISPAVQRTDKPVAIKTEKMDLGAYTPKWSEYTYIELRNLDSDKSYWDSIRHTSNEFYDIYACEELLTAGNYRVDIVRFAAGYEPSLQSVYFRVSESEGVSLGFAMEDVAGWEKMKTDMVSDEISAAFYYMLEQRDTMLVDNCTHEPAKTLEYENWIMLDEYEHSLSNVWHYRCLCGQVDYSEVKDDGVFAHRFEAGIEAGICTLCGCEDVSTPISVSYSEHPHYYRTKTYTDYTIVTKDENGYKLSAELCKDCFSTDFNSKTLQEMAQFAMWAYEMDGRELDEYPDMLSGAFRYNQEEFDLLVLPEYTDDGTLVLTLAFEGSDETSDWITDFTAVSDEKGLHAGFKERLDLLVKHVALKNVSLKEYFDVVKSGGGYIRITGHSYGGAMAQLMTWYFIKEWEIPTDRMCTYTFASPVPFTYGSIVEPVFRTANVYNIINVTDIVPDMGVTGDSIAELIVESLGNAFELQSASGGVVDSGCNLGTNYYLFDNRLSKGMIVPAHKMETYFDLVDALVKGEIDAYSINTDLFYGITDDVMWEYKDSAGDKVAYIDDVIETADGWFIYDEANKSLQFIPRQ